MRERFLHLLRFSLCLVVLIAGMGAPAAYANSTQTKDTQKFLGSFGDWRAYSSNDDNRPACYMALTQHFLSTKKLKRGPAYLTITHRPTEGSTDVVSFMPGYNFKPGSDAKARFGATEFDLFTQDSTAWTRDAHTDHALTAAIRAHDSMTLTGIPAAKGATAVTDKLNLKGAADAYRAIGKACGIKVDAPKASKLKAKTSIPMKKAN